MSVFSALANYRLIKIMHSSFEAVLQTMKHTIIYPGSGSYVQLFDIEDEQVLQRGEKRAREVHMVKGGN
jgi:hypothetical protein